jgi:hypothetical protein
VQCQILDRSNNRDLILPAYPSVPIAGPSVRPFARHTRTSPSPLLITAHTHTHAHPPPTTHPHPCRELSLKLEEDRKRLLEAINATFSNLGSAAADLLTDRNKLLAAVGGISMLALGVYSAREGTRVAGKAVDRWFGTPRLVSAYLGRARAGAGRGGAGWGRAG